MNATRWVPRTRNHAKTHLGQSHDGPCHCHSSVASQRQLKAATERGTVNGRDHGQGYGLNGENDVRQRRILDRRVEFANVGPCDERISVADNHDPGK